MHGNNWLRRVPSKMWSLRLQIRLVVDLCKLYHLFGNQSYNFFHLDHIRHHIGQSDLDLASRYCRPFRIGNSPEFGRHFVATRDILPLQEILCEKAAVIGPATQAIQVCLECLIPIELEGKKLLLKSGEYFKPC